MKKNKELIPDVRCSRPHVFILGAGASVAAFPDGDRNGRCLPTMDNFVDVVGLKDMLEANNVDYEGKNFEGVFDTLYSRGGQDNLVKAIEEKIRDYFESLEIPDSPTIYDYLILSLRKKDRIATFNWDPLLWQAASRINSMITKRTPNLLFLHGNVAFKINHKTRKKVHVYSNAPSLVESQLLYPIRNKNYSSDPFIKDEWGALKHHLSRAYLFTVFGYSAPNTDIDAINLLREGWTGERERDLEEVEIIDIKSENILEEKWKDFIFSHHRQIKKNFFNSLAASFPRRSCEAIYQETMEAKFLHRDDGFSDGMDFDELREWVAPLLAVEDKESR